MLFSSIRPKFAWADKGLVLMSLRRYEESIDCFNKALELGIDDISGMLTFKGNALFSSRRFQEAIECYDKALEMNRDNPIVWEKKGTVTLQYWRIPWEL